MRHLFTLLWENLRHRYQEWVIERAEARGEVYPLIDQIRDGWRVR